MIGDPIILEYGMQLVQTSNNLKRRTVVVRNKMRECARILIEFKKIIVKPLDSIATIIGKYQEVTYMSSFVGDIIECLKILFRQVFNF